MANDGFPTEKLGPLCSKVGSGATPRGGSKVYLNKGHIVLIRSQNVYNDGFNREGLVYITAEHAEDLSNVAVETEDVLLNITGDSVARCCLVDPHILPARVNQHVSIVRPKPDELIPRFLRYFLVSPTMQAQMISWAHAGATRKALTKGMIESFKVPKPGLPIQQRIGHILGTLDDKIDLNRRMNRTLEKMAAAIFKSWFIDFDPVRARAKGQDTGLPQNIADLFPDSFENSALGPIPRGWGIRSLDKVAQYLNGLACQKFPPAEGEKSIPVIKIRELRQGITTNTDRSTANVPTEYIIENGDMLFSWSGSLRVTIWCNGPGVLNQHVFKVTSVEFPKWFIYHWTKYHLNDFQQIAADKATTMGHIKRQDLTDARVVVPDYELIEKGSEILGVMLNRQINALKQSHLLSLVRDTLLPDLLSGEIALDSAEELV